MVDGHYTDLPPIAPFPAAEGALIESGNVDYLVQDDFNRTSRFGAADVGAYAFRNVGNPGWPIAEEFKSINDFVRPRPPDDLRTD
jgi:hypothetical protein